MKKVCSWTIAAALSALYPTIALGQTTTPRRPVEGVFGGAGSNSTDRESLSATVSLEEAYDQNVIVDSGDTRVPLFQASGPYTMVTPTIDYAMRGNRVQLAVTASSNARYYNELGKTAVANYSVGAGLAGNLSSATSVSVNQGLTYSPALFYGLLSGGSTPNLGAVVAPGSNYALNEARSYASATTMSLTQKISRHNSVVVTSNLRTTQFLGDDPTYPDLRSYDVGARLSNSVSRGIGLQMGYVFRQTQYASLPRSTEHDFNIGGVYNRPWSRTRKTSATFALGPTIVDGALSTGSAEIVRQYRVSVDAALRHQIGRTWSLDATYHRGMGYIEGFQSPVFTGAYTTSASGFLSRRTDLSVSAAYSSGESALAGTPDAFTTYTADARLRVAVNRTWAAYAEYVFYYYEFNHNMVLPDGLPPGLTRNGVRFGLTLWIPVRHR